MARIQQSTHVVVHTHRFGTDRTLFLPPQGFDVPYGLYGSEATDWEDSASLSALLSYLNVSFEPELEETVEIIQMEEEIHEPSLRDLKRLMPRTASKEVELDD